MSKFDGLKLLKEDSDPRAEQEPQQEPQRADLSVKKVPRRVGKRVDPRYQQVSVYVRKDLYEDIRKRLIGKDKDFSDLLERWMGDWTAEEH